MKEKTIVEQLDKKIKEEEKLRRTPYQNFIVIILAVLGGCSVLIEMVTPLILIFIWVKLFGFYGWGSYLFYIIGFLATTYRAIRIGFLK
jgi:hypothetical protein